jgi:tellurite resistance protein
MLHGAIMSSTISPQTALIYCMVIAAVANDKLAKTEIGTIGEIARGLPAFKDLHPDQMSIAIGDCSSLLDQADGLDAVIGLVKEALPRRLRETAYALACDVVAADGIAEQPELRWLEMLRDELGINRLHAAAIERGARARYARP